MQFKEISEEVLRQIQRDLDNLAHYVKMIQRDRKDQLIDPERFITKFGSIRKDDSDSCREIQKMTRRDSERLGKLHFKVIRKNCERFVKIGQEIDLENFSQILQASENNDSLRH